MASVLTKLGKGRGWVIFVNPIKIEHDRVLQTLMKMVGGTTGTSQVSKSRLVNQTLTMPYLRVIHARNSIWDRAYRCRLVPHERTYHLLLTCHATVGRAAEWEM
jgi:hypothetical protein